MKRRTSSLILSIAASAAAISSAEAQSTRRFRCDDGVRPFTVTVTVLNQGAIRVANLDGRTMVLRLTERRGGNWTFAGGQGNEYNMMILASQDHASLNKPNSETIECPLAVASTQPRPMPQPLSSCPPGTVPVPETDNCVPVRRAQPRGGPAFCAQPRSEVQATICGDANLRSFEGTLQTAYRRATSDSRQKLAEINQEQRRWVGRRESCGPDAGCITRRNQEQLQFLESYFNN